MSEARPQSRALRAMRASSLEGAFMPPGYQGLTARALMLGALAMGETRLTGFATTADTARLMDSLRGLGAEIELGDGTVNINGLGSGGLLEPRTPLDLGGDLTAAILMMGLVGLYPFETRIYGEGALAGHDLTAALGPLRFMGVRITADKGRFLPVTVKGPVTPVPFEVHLHADSGAVKGAVLMAALNCPGITTIVEPAPSQPATELLLGAFGARVVMKDMPGGIHVTEITGLPNLRGRSLAIPADPRCALYPMMAALIVPGSDLLLRDVLAAPSRLSIIMTLIEMGADITVTNPRDVGGIPFADIRVRHSQLHGIELPDDRAQAMVGDYPLLALAAAFANGTTTLPGLSPPQDHDRLSELAIALTAAGGNATRSAGSMVVNGSGRLRGAAALRSRRDPMLTLIYLLMGMAARDPVTIDDDSAIAMAYPGFVELFEALGVRFSRIV